MMIIYVIVGLVLGIGLSTFADKRGYSGGQMQIIGILLVALAVLVKVLA